MTNAILGIPCYSYSMICPQNPILITKTPIVVLTCQLRIVLSSCNLEVFWKFKLFRVAVVCNLE